MDDEYRARKIANCKELINSATSPEQKEIYEGYLIFWQGKHKHITIKPKATDEIYDDSDHEAMFAIEYPNKKAYYKRNGVIYQTKAFQEFLKSFE